MKKNKFIVSTFILLVGGFITKILSLFIKIIMTRIIKTDGIMLYTLTIPTYNLFVTLTTIGNPNVVSKLVSERKYKNKNILLSSFMLSFIFSIILLFILILFSKKISILLHNEDLYLPILFISFSLPFISISSSIRGYFFGKQNMFPHVISNFIEQISRIIIFILFLPLIKNVENKVILIILTNTICEIISIIVLLLFLPKKVNINELNLKINKEITKEILSISIPTTFSRLIGTISTFLEPIILTNLLIHNGIDKKFIQYQYGLINGYVIPLLLLPSFFSLAISQSIIPVISKNYSIKNISYIRKKIKEVNLLSFLIGFIYVSIIYINPKYFFNLIYNTSEGYNYFYLLGLPFILLYIQGPNISILQALNKTKQASVHTLIGILLKFLTLIILSFLNMHIYSLIISIIINIIYVTVSNYILIKKTIK